MTKIEQKSELCELSTIKCEKRGSNVVNWTGLLELRIIIIINVTVLSPSRSKDVRRSLACNILN